MTIDPLVALVVAVITVNLVVAWLLVRGGGELRGFALDDVERRVDRRDGSDGSDSDRGPGPSELLSTVNRTGSTGDERDRTGTLPVGDPPPLSTDGEVVVCRHCGAENRPGYRYCRWCVRAGFTDIGPGSDADADATGRPF